MPCLPVRLVSVSSSKRWNFEFCEAVTTVTTQLHAASFSDCNVNVLSFVMFLTRPKKTRSMWMGRREASGKPRGDGPVSGL